MGKKRGNAIHIAVIAGVTMIVACAGGAEVAAAADFNISDEGSGNVSDGTLLEFDLFDSSLGTLTGVTFTLESGKMADQDLDADNDVGGSGSLDLSFDISFDGLSFFEQDDELTTLCSFEEGVCADFKTLSLEFDGMFVVGTDGGDINDFIINGGGTFDIGVGFIGESFVEGQEGDIASVFNFAEWSGSLRVDYTFTPVTSVPEPASLALFGTGLAGLAGFGFLAGRRRRRD